MNTEFFGSTIIWCKTKYYSRQISGQTDRQNYSALDIIESSKFCKPILYMNR